MGMCIHNIQAMEYLRVLTRRMPKGKFNKKATPPIKIRIIISIAKIIDMANVSQVCIPPLSTQFRNVRFSWNRLYFSFSFAIISN